MSLLKIRVPWGKKNTDPGVTGSVKKRSCLLETKWLAWVRDSLKAAFRHRRIILRKFNERCFMAKVVVDLTRVGVVKNRPS